MKQLLTILLLCCLCRSASAQQTYIRNYSTFTEYGTIPAATVPSSYKSYTPAPSYEYKAPEKSAEDVANDEEIQDVIATRKELELYYAQKDYKSVLAICKDFEERYPEGSLHPDIGIYMTSAYLNTSQYEVLAEKINNKYQYFGDRHDFELAVADVLQQYGYYKMAFWYYKLAAKANYKFDGYEMGYAVTAAREGEEWEAISAFSKLMSATNDNPNNYYNRALAFLNIKNPSRDLALKDLVTFTAEATETLDAYLLMAKIFAAKANWEECIVNAREYLKLHESEEARQLITKAEGTLASPEYKQKIIEAEEKRISAIAMAEALDKKKITDQKKLETEYANYIREHKLSLKTQALLKPGIIPRIILL
jgi:hypothetical protein